MKLQGFNPQLDNKKAICILIYLKCIPIAMGMTKHYSTIPIFFNKKEAFMFLQIPFLNL